MAGILLQAQHAGMLSSTEAHSTVVGPAGGSVLTAWSTCSSASCVVALRIQLLWTPDACMVYRVLHGLAWGHCESLRRHADLAEAAHGKQIFEHK